MTEYYKNTIKLRKESDAFTSGEFETVYKFERGYGFIRKSEKESYIVLVNSGGNNRFRLDIARFGIKKLASLETDEQHIAEDGIFYVDMPEVSVKIFKCS